MGCRKKKPPAVDLTAPTDSNPRGSGEPLFCAKPSIFSSDMLEDWLYYLAAKNANSILQDNLFRECCTAGNTVELIFNVCSQLKQTNHGVKYLAVELFDRFLLQHIQDLQEEVSNRTKLQQPLNWEDVEVRITKQMMLRIVSCVQIASKVISHSEYVSIASCRSFLSSVGHSYGTESILNSELRILKTLNYKVEITTPLIYLETLLEILGHNDAYIKPAILYDMSLKILDFVYITRNKIYADLFNMTTKDEESVLSPCKITSFRSVKSNDLLLTSAIITSAAYFVNQKMQQKVLAQLHQVTQIPEVDITDLSCLILENLLDSEN